MIWTEQLVIGTEQLVIVAQQIVLGTEQLVIGTEQLVIVAQQLVILDLAPVWQELNGRPSAGIGLLLHCEPTHPPTNPPSHRGHTQ